MKFTLQTRDRRALILMACALGIYFLFSEVVFPAYDNLAASEGQALEKETQLARYRRALARASDHDLLLEDARGRVAEGEARLISGDNPSLASAQLQTLIEAAADRSGIELGQRNISPARLVDDYFSEIAISLTFVCAPGQLVEFLSDIRSAEGLVIVRAVQVSPLQGTDGIPAGELIKDLNVNVTFGAVLATPSVANPNEAPDEG